jgi:hypothetical protein
MEKPETPMPGSLHPLVSRMGVTVAELKKHIASWPETDAMGEPTEVWLETGHQLSSPCMSVELLNYRMRDDGTHTSDLLLCPSETAWNPANDQDQRPADNNEPK